MPTTEEQRPVDAPHRLRFSKVRIFTNAFGELRRRFVPLLAFTIVVRLAASLALGPLYSALLTRIIGMKGRYSFGNEDIVDFLISPTGLFTTVVVGSLTWFAQTAEMAGMMLIGREALQGRMPSIVSVGIATARVSLRLLGLALRQWLVYVVMGAPFIGMIGLTYYVLWSGQDLNYLWQKRPPLFWIGGGIATVAVLIYAALAANLFVRWIFATPLCVFEGKSGADALKASARLAAGQKSILLAVIVAWGVVFGAIDFGSLAVLKLISRLVLSRIGESLAIAIPTISALLALHAAVLAAISFVANAVAALLLLQLYGGEQAEAIPARSESSNEQQNRHFEDSKPIRLSADAPAGWLPRRSSILIAIGAVVVTSIVMSYGLIASMNVEETLQITGHRGDASEAPENTVAAIKAAIAAGADYAEIDVQLTADGILIVTHDEDLRRQLNIRKKITDMTFAEIRKLDIGSVFSPQFRGERIPTLDEVLDAASSHIRMNIEIKHYPKRAIPPLVKATLESIARKNFRSNCLVMSLSYEVLQEVRRQDRLQKIGYIVSGAVGDLTRLDVDVLSVRDALATPRLISAATRRGKPVHAWTVDDPKRMLRLWERGVVNVISNDPRAMVARRNEIRDRSVVERLVLRARTLLTD